VTDANEFSSYFKASNSRLQYKAEALNSVKGKIAFNFDNQTRYANKLCGHNCALFTLKADNVCIYSRALTV